MYAKKQSVLLCPRRLPRVIKSDFGDTLYFPMYWRFAYSALHYLVNNCVSFCSCFIRIGYAFYLTQVLLLVLTVCFNAYIFARVMYKLSYGRVQSSSTRNTSRMSEMKTRARRAFTLSSLLGLTWVFGILSLIHQDAAFTFQILFAIFTSLQGLFVFIMFGVLNNEIRGIWKVWFCYEGATDLTVQSNSTSKTGSNTATGNKTDMTFTEM